MNTSRGSTTTTVLITLGAIIVLAGIWHFAMQKGAQEASSTATTTAVAPTPESVTVVAVGQPIYYGGKSDMRATITSITGQDTGNAVMGAKVISTGAQISATASCTTGSFTDFTPNEAYQYQGANPNHNASDPSSPRYLVKDLADGSILTDSGVDGYRWKLDIYKALCPTTGPTRPF